MSVFWLFLALGPLLVHLWRWRRPQAYSWGAMGYLGSAQARLRKRLRRERYLRVLLQCLACVCLLLPGLWGSWWSQGGLQQTGRRAVILAVDDSWSQYAQAEGRSGQERLQPLLTAVAEQLRAGDEFVLLAQSSLPVPLVWGPAERGPALEMLERLRPQAVGSDLSALTRTALEHLRHMANPYPLVFIADDGRDDGWQGDWTLTQQLWQAEKMREHAPRLFFIRPPRTTVAPGRSISRFLVSEEVIAQDEEVNLIAEVQISGAIPPGRVQFFVEGRLWSEEPVTVISPGHGIAQTRWQAGHAGDQALEAVVLGEGDANAHDDRASAVAVVADSLPVLLVEGEQGQGLFIDRALAARGGLFAVESVLWSELRAQQVERARVVVLVDVPALDTDQVAALERLVLSGGGIWVCAGAGAQPEIMDRLWARGGDGFLPALPGPLRFPGSSGISVDQRSHPILRLLGEVSWGEVRLDRIRNLQVLPDTRGLSVLLRAGGQALMVCAERGSGRVAVLGLALDRRGSDLPLQAAFVPLVQETVRYVGARIGERRRVPTVLPWELGSRAQAPQFVGPSGQQAAVEPLGGARYRISLPSPGIWQEGTWKRWAAVIPEQEIQSLDPLAESEFARWGVPTLQTPEAIRVALSDDEGGNPALQWLRYLALCLLVAEALWPPGAGLVRSTTLKQGRRVEPVT